ncbi:MAG: M20 family metallopeptidase [Gemmatimonadetes bacterium]|nr:M20 family metallopeptidase [Gemmatimonadota bacterium]NNF39720.1 M20 family metallopeptidase [Gemmatimonadota bacterium]
MTEVELDRPPPTDDARRRAARILAHVRGLTDEFVEFVSELARMESPTDDPGSQEPVQAHIASALEPLGFSVRRIAARGVGDHFLARPRTRSGPLQLLVGHTDTVWPHGTLAGMPVQVVDGRLHGPGTLDMKGGVSQMVFALRTLTELGLEPPATPVIFLNTDEEIGSPDSKRHVRRLARIASRCFVPEPALAPDGRIKTARKGVGRFRVSLRGRAAHAGLEPEAGASAIRELAHWIAGLDALNDPESGTTLNVGVVHGGTRANVVAAEASAEIDVRVLSTAEGERVEKRIREMPIRDPRVVARVTGGFASVPLERTPRNRRLWAEALRAGDALGFELAEATAGGGSDGNTTSLYTATLDGLGCVGDGPHADHEHLRIDATVDRCALLATLLLAPIGR